jgi:hypothetical protein
VRRIRSELYTFFTPPAEFVQRLPAEWSDAEARRYLLWLSNQVTPRTDALLTFLGVEADADCANVLKYAGERVIWIMRKPGFVDANNQRLSEAGLSLGADLGLLVARCLLDADDSVHWDILRRPKSDASYQLPVLRGFGTHFLEPIRGSIAELGRFARDEAKSDAWLRMFEYWNARIVSR